ncbi:MAG: protein adenylyltransferase SelO family protein, partial [Polaribacter sp.]
MNLNIKNSFTTENPADSILDTTRRQVTEAVFSFVTPKKTKAPKVVHVSQEMAADLGIDKKETESEFFKNIFTGNEVYPNTSPFAMCYGGHQFGN